MQNKHISGSEVQAFRTWDLNQQEFVQRNWERVNSNAHGRSNNFEQMLVGWGEIYLENEKFKRSLYNHLMKNKTE